MKVLKVIGLTIILLSLSVLVGCSAKVTANPEPSVTATSTDTSPTPTPKIPVSTTKPNSARDLAWEEAHQSSPWINPGSIDISNFRAGGRVEYPVYFHNGSDNIFTQQAKVTTGTNDPQVTITLQYKLLDSDSKNISEYVSDLPEDKLTLTGYNPSDNSLTLNGLVDNTQRIITLTYTSTKTYLIYYRMPDHPPEGYSMPDSQVKDWVTLSESKLEMNPRETKEIIVTLEMPDNASTSTKSWAYLIAVSEATMVATENTSTCRVVMR